MSSYQLKSLNKLFRIYADENTRIDKNDAAKTQELVRNELHRRLQTALTLLETATTEAEADKIYQQFIEF